MTISKRRQGTIAILLVVLCIHPSSALPDILAPIRSMFGMHKGPGSSNSPYGKPPSFEREHSSSSQFSGPPEGSPFSSDFGFGKPPVPQSQGGAPPNYFSSSSVAVQQPPQVQASPSYSRPNPKPSGPGSRVVRQQPGGFPSSPFRRPPPPGSSPGFRGPPSFAPGRGPEFPKEFHSPQPLPPSQYRAPEHDDNEGYKYLGEGAPSFDGDDGPPQGFQGGRGPRPGGPPRDGAPPNFNRGPPGPPPRGPYRNPGGPPRGPPGGQESEPNDEDHDGPSNDFEEDEGQGGQGQGQGQGFTGFGSFPGGEEDDEHISGPPQGRPPRQGSPPPFGGGGPGGPPPHYNPSSRPPPFGQGSSPFGGRPGPGGHGPHHGPGGHEDDDNAPQGGSPAGFPGFPEFNDHPRSPHSGRYNNDEPSSSPGGPKRPTHIIGGNDANRYPPQLNNDDHENSPPQQQGPGRFRSFGGPAGQNGPQSGPRNPWSQPYNNNDVQDAPPHGAEDSPSSPPSGPSSSPNKNMKKRRPMKMQKFASSFSTPVSASYQASSEPILYGKPMMSSASAPGRSFMMEGAQKRRLLSAKIPQVGNQDPRLIHLVSPPDPNYQPMIMSSSSPMTAYEPETAASGHGEGLSSNGDRILYHVSGHQGPKSYRFGYDTGKGKNRLFRFEEKDGKGYVKGKYGFYDKHGKLQVINYEAHPKHGFHAERAHPHN